MQEGEINQSIIVSNKTPEKLIDSAPRLRYINQAFGVLRQPIINSSGEQITWRDLAQKVKSFKTGIELSDNIREVVVDFVVGKIPLLKEKIPMLNEFSNQNITDALANNWFEDVDEKIEGNRSEILFSVMAHVVKKIENYTYRKILESASQENLKNLGLNTDTRDLLVELLDIGIKADPLYIRFMAYSQLTPQPDENASSVGLNLPHHDKPYTIASLFPRETSFLSKHLGAISLKEAQWQGQIDGPIFSKYLRALSEFYSESDTKKAGLKQKEIEYLYEQTLLSDFPIVITPATEGYYKEPYFDPELKISIVSPEANKEKKSWEKAREAMSKSLGVLDIPQFAGEVLDSKIKSLIAIGGFGVNITFNVVAQEKPAIVVFLNDQLRAYDRDFAKNVQKIVGNNKEQFGETISAEKKELLEVISRTGTILHELVHSFYPDYSEEAQRLGRRSLTTIDEVKAEICHRALIPSILDKGGLNGTKEEWATALVTGSFIMAKEQPEGDPYYYAGTYCLNEAFEKGALKMQDNQVYITDFNRYYEIQISAAKKILAVYQNPRMTERKASQWIKEYCVPNEQVKQGLEMINL